MAKLVKVPISTYSVVFMSCALFNSPNLNTDFAANKKPIPSMLSVKINVSINMRSKYPIHLPAFGKPCVDISSGIQHSYLMNNFIRIDVGANTAIYAVEINQKEFGSKLPVIGAPLNTDSHHIPVITA